MYNIGAAERAELGGEMAEKTADFARRMGSDVRTFVQEKSKEVADRVETGLNDFAVAVDEASYRVSLKSVADKFGLKSKEVKRILRAHTRTIRK